MAAQDGGGLAEAEEASLGQLRQRLQRDLNCLSDQDRSTRRRALTKMQQIFFQEGKQPEPVMRGYFARYLSARLVSMLGDPVEKCREMAGGLLMKFLAATEDVPAESADLATKVFCAVEARVGAVPLIEPAEEVRALLLRLCYAVVSRDSAELFANEVGDPACAILSASLTDSFPDAKRECCSLLLRLAAVCPGELRSRSGKILRPLVANLSHQHSKTRQRTLQALSALLLCGSDDMDKLLKELVIPQLRNLLYDRTLAVRRELAVVLAALVEAGMRKDASHSDGDGDAGGCAPMEEASSPGDTNASASASATKYLEPFRPELMSLLMSLLADESDAVTNEARKLLDAVGEAWGRSHPEEVNAKLAEERAPLFMPPSASTSGVEGAELPAPCSGTGPGVDPRTGSGSDPMEPAGSDASGNRLEAHAGCVSARALCVSLLPRMMPAAIDDVAHWTARGRRRAIWLLCFLVRYVGEDVTPYLPQLLGALGEASRDDEPEVREAVDRCATAVGCVVSQLSAVTDVLLPSLRGEVSGQNSAQHLTQVLSVLRPVIAASARARPSALAPLVKPICRALRGTGMLGVDPAADGELWDATLEACRAVVDSGMGDELRRPEVRLDLLRVMLWLLAGCGAASGGRAVRYEDGADASEEVMGIAARLARENACPDPQELFSRHFKDLLASVVGNGLAVAEEEETGKGVTDGEHKVVVRGWEKGSPRRSGFEALLRCATRAVGCHLGEVMPIFRRLLHNPRSQAELRLTMLALLECVMKQPEVTEEALRPHAQVLLRDMVVPNAVWQAGLVAATVRKVAIAVLYTALRGKKLGVEAIYSTAEQLLPIMKTNLEDHEASTRQMTCLSLEMMLRMIPGALGEQPVSILYPELLKRLDDSNDTVRRAVCGTLAAFFKATAPQNVRGTPLRYSLEQLLVHMDDQDVAMQEAVLEVAKVLASIDASLVGKMAADARSSHRSTDYCDRLVDYAATV